MSEKKGNKNENDPIEEYKSEMAKKYEPIKKDRLKKRDILRKELTKKGNVYMDNDKPSLEHLMKEAQNKEIDTEKLFAKIEEKKEQSQAKQEQKQAKQEQKQAKQEQKQAKQEQKQAKQEQQPSKSGLKEAAKKIAPIAAGVVVPPVGVAMAAKGIHDNRVKAKKGFQAEVPTATTEKEAKSIGASIKGKIASGASKVHKAVKGKYTDKGQGR